MPDHAETLAEALRQRTKRLLPRDWQKGRKCPQCDTDADRQKCMWDMGGSCPRHDPDNYEPSPYKEVPDKLCHDAANELDRLRAALAAYDAAKQKETTP